MAEIIPPEKEAKLTYSKYRRISSLLSMENSRNPKI
jgi:hypothetical protein